MRLLVFLFFLCSIRCCIGQDSLHLFSKKEQFKSEVTSDSIFSLKAKSGVIPFFFHSMGEQAKAPFHMNGKQILLTVGVIGVTGVLIHFDEEIDAIFKPLKEKNKFIRNFSPEYTQLGEFYAYGILAGVFTFSAITHNYKPFHTSILAAQSAITAGIWTRVGKIMTGRMRPGATYNDLEFNQDHWFGPLGQFNPKYKNGRSIAAFDAFPSGHTAIAFAIATAFAKQYGNHKAVPIILYSLAGIVGISRLVEHEHWASDILPGAALGYLCADQVFRYDKKLKEGKKTASLRIFPTYLNGPGVSIIMLPK